MFRRTSLCVLTMRWLWIYLVFAGIVSAQEADKNLLSFPYDTLGLHVTFTDIGTNVGHPDWEGVLVQELKMDLIEAGILPVDTSVCSKGHHPCLRVDLEGQPFPETASFQREKCYGYWGSIGLVREVRFAVDTSIVQTRAATWCKPIGGIFPHGYDALRSAENEAKDFLVEYLRANLKDREHLAHPRR